MGEARDVRRKLGVSCAPELLRDRRFEIGQNIKLCIQGIIIQSAHVLCVEAKGELDQGENRQRVEAADKGENLWN